MKWSSLAEKVHQSLKSNALLKEGDRILLAVSGGMDSVVMASVLMELKDQWHWDMIVGHIDHGLRPGQDEQESQLCERLAQSFGLQYREKKISLNHQSDNQHTTQSHSLESLAREKRYDVLEKWADDMACNVICTAHHESDQAETILYRMLTGSGLRGLRGIPESRGRIKRPLLFVSKDDIETYAKERQLIYADDPSNQDQTFIRNKIRHQVIPELVKAGFVSAEKSLSDSADALDEAFAAMDYYTKKDIDRTICVGPQGVELDHHPFLALPAFTQKRILNHVMMKHLNVMHHISDRQFEQMISFIRTSEPGSQIHMAGCDLVNNRKNFLWPINGTQDMNKNSSCKPGTVELSRDSFLEIQIIKCPSDLKTANAFVAYFSMSLFEADLTIRSWQSGDKMIVFGEGKKKKVSDILKDEKVMPRTKTNYPVLELDDQLIWIPGVKRSNLFSVEKHDETLIMMTYKCGDGQ